MEDEDGIYDIVRQLVAVSPKMTQYDSKESVIFVFNKPLLADGGPYEAEFKGQHHCLRVPAVLLNSCTLQAHAPVYYPPETTTVSIYDKLKQHEPSIARCSFEFFARGQLLQELLEKASDPDMLLCDSLGVSSTDLKTFDDVIAGKLKEKAPEGFNLLKMAQERGPPVSNTRFPTLLHLGATYGLTLTVAACLHYCPAAHQACLLKNVDGNTPIEISRKLGSHEITKCLQDFQSNKCFLKNNNQLGKEGDFNDNDENEDIYMEMRPSMALDKIDREHDYVRMPEIGTNTNPILMTPELQSAVSLAENAIRLGWLKGDFDEATFNAFRQIIERGTEEQVDDPTYSLPRDLGPVLPPRSNRLTNKRHSIHDIPNSAPPLPPRSPGSVKSPQFLLGHQTERRGSDPSIFHRMQPNFADKLTICEENGTIHQARNDSPPKLPAKTRSPLSATQGAQHHLPGGFLSPKSSSNDATSMGLSPRLPPRNPKLRSKTRSASCEPDLPVQNLARTRTFSVPR